MKIRNKRDLQQIALNHLSDIELKISLSPTKIILKNHFHFLWTIDQYKFLKFNAKDQYKFLKFQINVIDNNREDDVKAEEFEIIHNVDQR